MLLSKNFKTYMKAGIFLYFNLVVKRLRSTQGQHLNDCGYTGVPSAMYQVSRPSVHVFWKIRFLKVFTIYGHGGHTGHMTWRIEHILWNFVIIGFVASEMFEIAIL